VETTKKAGLVLIARYFGLPLLEAKREAEHLTAEDKAQLASAIAREQGLTEDGVQFDLVAY
jgi:hypothetical protein